MANPYVLYDSANNEVYQLFILVKTECVILIMRAFNMKIWHGLFVTDAMVSSMSAIFQVIKGTQLTVSIRIIAETIYKRHLTSHRKSKPSKLITS